MRLIDKQVTVRSILFSRPAAFVYMIISGIFIYKCMLLLPIWITAKDKAELANEDYQKKVQLSAEKEESIKNKDSQMGKARYQKDFFNKLEDGENLIILYGEEKEDLKVEEVRKMFWWQEWKQDFIVWWKNL